MKLDVGCGSSKKKDFIGIDILDFKGVDIVHDLGTFPYPFDDNSVDEIWMDQVLEHLINPTDVLNELYRICKNNAKITIGVPYFRSFYSCIDPTHRNFFGVYWFDYFDQTRPFAKRYNYLNVNFKIHYIEFDREIKSKPINFFRKSLINFAEKKPYIYESKLSHFFPLDSLTFHLTAIK